MRVGVGWVGGNIALNVFHAIIHKVKSRLP